MDIYIYIYITKGLKIFSILLLESHGSLQWIFSLRRTWKETQIFNTLNMYSQLLSCL